MNKTENATIINGIVLTEPAIEFLKSLQSNDNSYHKEAREYINLTISGLLTYLNYIDDEYSPEVLDLVKYLNSFNKSFSLLMKP